MNSFKMSPDAWTYVDKILENASSPHTKFYALQILDEAVNVSKNSLHNLIAVTFLSNRQDGKFYQKIKSKAFAHILYR